MKKPLFAVTRPYGASLNLYGADDEQARVEIHTTEIDSVFALNPVEMLDFGNQMTKLANELLLAEAIDTAFSMRDEDDRFAVLRELGSVQEVAAKYESFNTLHIEKLSDFDRAVVLAVGMAYRDVLQSYLHADE